MKEGWEIKSLGDVCNLQNGYAFKSKTYVPSSNTLNIRMSNIRPDGSFNPEHNIKYLPDNFSDEYSQFLLEEGDLIIAMTDMAGDPKILGLPTIVKNLKGRNFLLNQRVGKLKDFTDDIYVPYLCYFLGSPKIKEYYKSKGAGGLQINISKKDILTADIPIPLLPEQKQIVTILDKAFAAIAQAQANIEKNMENAKELFQSKLNEIFSQPALSGAEGKGEGWEEKKFKDVCVLQRGFDLPKRLRKHGEYPLVSSSGIIDTHIEAKVKAPGVVTGRSGSVGNLFYIEDDFWPLNTTLYIKDFKGNFEEYVYYFIKQFDLKRFSSGAGVPTLNRNFVHDEIVYSTSDIETQKQIVNQLNDLKSETETIECHYQQKLNNLEDLKKSLLQKAFSGELTQNPVVA